MIGAAWAPPLPDETRIDVADISIRKRHPFDDPADLRSRIEGLAEKVAERLGGTWAWDGDAAVCEARGATARVGFDTNEVTIDVSLPLPFRPLAGKLEAKIDEYYARYFERG